jgi:serine/threonine-protein kinase
VIEVIHRGSGSWTIIRALGILLKACDALAYAHAKGVVHRDLKPANIMVGKFGAAYVMDWGLARIVEHGAGAKALPDGAMTVHIETSRPPEQTSEHDPLRTQVGAYVGTPLYMSPEQARGDLANVGPRSDIYGLGAILYHLLAGIPPYH